MVKEYKTKYVRELPYGIEISNESGWIEAIDFAKDNNTKLVETHFCYKGRDSGEIDIESIYKPPKSIFIYFVVTNSEILLERQNERHYGSDIETVEMDLKWYDDVYKQIPENQRKLILNV